MTVGIYRIVNTVTGKCYIGQSQNIKLRWRHHIQALRRGDSRSTKLQNSYNKHGESVFEFEVLEECEKDMLDDREQLWIDMYDSFHDGYNNQPMAASCRGISRSEETKKRMSEAAKKTWSRDDIRKKRIQSLKDVTSEAREARSRSAKECWKDPEIRKKMIAGIKNSRSDPDVMERIRQNIIASKATAEARERQRQVANELYARPGFREKKSEMTKRDWADPEKKALRVLRCRLTRASKKLVILDNGN